jgi:hypothetical protein
MAPLPVFSSGNTAVITGGASGIGMPYSFPSILAKPHANTTAGLALATKCAGYGMNVIIVDNNTDNLKSAKDAIKGSGIIETVQVDVSQIGDFESVKDAVGNVGGGELLFPFSLRLGVSLVECMKRLKLLAVQPLIYVWCSKSLSATMSLTLRIISIFYILIFF